MPRLFILLLAIFSMAAHAGDAVRVLVTIKPVHSLVSQLLQGIAEPELLLDGYQSPHTFQLRPSDARKLTQADVIIWVGPTLETNLQKTLRQANDKLVIRLTESEEEHHGADHLHIDPHRWLDPVLAQADVTRITESLSRLYPGHAGHIMANNRQLVKRLQLLDKEIRKYFSENTRTSAILYHDAWHYFQQRYGITTHGIINPDAHKQPGAHHLYEVSQTIKDRHTQCLLIEPQFKPKYLG
ncbi:MAG: zinc ABC transporter substrate-binding protein, partial [Gammaproteobacteria bacterium]|nr:zinc ABC transporter substrate-binding protein [Gammaproteobacteria bacterium]